MLHLTPTKHCKSFELGPTPVICRGSRIADHKIPVLASRCIPIVRIPVSVQDFEEDEVASGGRWIQAQNGIFSSRATCWVATRNQVTGLTWTELFEVDLELVVISDLLPLLHLHISLSFIGK